MSCVDSTENVNRGDTDATHYALHATSSYDEALEAIPRPYILFKLPLISFHQSLVFHTGLRPTVLLFSINFNVCGFLVLSL